MFKKHMKESNKRTKPDTKRYLIKLGKDGKYRVGRRVVIQSIAGFWMFKATGRAFIELI